MYGRIDHIPIELMSDKQRRTIAFLSLLDMNLWLFRRRLMATLVEKGWNVVAITPPGDYCQRFSQIGVRHIPYKMNRKGTNPIEEALVVWQLVHILRQIKPALVQTFTIKPNTYGTLAAKIARIPFIINAVTGLGTFFIENGENTMRMRYLLMTLYRISGALADRVIFQNDDDLAFFTAKGLIHLDKAKLIRGSGVDLRHFDPLQIKSEKRKQLRQELRVKDSQVVVTMLTRLIWDKGVREFCQAASQLHKKYQDQVTFLLVGDFYEGNPRSVPRAYIADVVAREDIIFTGWRDDIPQVLDSSDIVVLPSYREGLPVSLQEALAMGKPIVTTDVTGCRETVEDGMNGFLVPVRNAQALAGAIGRMIENPKMRQEMGHHSRKKAEREFDVEQITKQYLELYAEVLNESSVEN
jgi:N,N'-diacetylbacillosaminyl-diphospho-undecaprenol alpha-1,3-N-acetylgalactosaminyltransferase